MLHPRELLSGSVALPRLLFLLLALLLRPPPHAGDRAPPAGTATDRPPASRRSNPAAAPGQRSRSRSCTKARHGRGRTRSAAPDGRDANDTTLSAPILVGSQTARPRARRPPSPKNGSAANRPCGSPAETVRA